MNVIVTQPYSIMSPRFSMTRILYTPTPKRELENVKKLIKDGETIFTHVIENELIGLLYNNIIDIDEITNVYVHRNLIAKVEFDSGAKLYATSPYVYKQIAHRSIRHYKENIKTIVNRIYSIYKQIGVTNGFSFDEVVRDYVSLTNTHKKPIITKYNQGYYIADKSLRNLILDISEPTYVNDIQMLDVYRSSLYSLLNNDIFPEDVKKLAKKLSELQGEHKKPTIESSIQKFIPIQIADGTFSLGVKNVNQQENTLYDSGFVLSITTREDSIDIFLPDDIYTLKLNVKYSSFGNKHNKFLIEYFNLISDLIDDLLLVQFFDSFIVKDFYKNTKTFDNIIARNNKDFGKLSFEDKDIGLLIVNENYFEYYKNIYDDTMLFDGIIIRCLDEYCPLDPHNNCFIILENHIITIGPNWRNRCALSLSLQPYLV